MSVMEGCEGYKECKGWERQDRGAVVADAETVGEARTLRWPGHGAEPPLLGDIAMSPGDDTPRDRFHNSLDQLRHDLKTPLTTIHGRAQLLTRAVRRSPSLADEERTKMLEGLA